ncbi:MAG: folate-binding protein YgfZ [Bdellovibrio sp.]|nr:folate-binding protein YgfZ [Methylotenera sp.]
MTTINLNTGSDILCDLSQLGMLEISGADAITFLQGQLTNDVKLLLGTNAHYTAYCNPKGRMLALFLAFMHHNSQLGDHHHLQLNRELLEPIMKRLKMYVMRSKVEIKDVSGSIVKFGLNGPEAASLLSPMFSQIPIQDFELVSLENGAILKLPSANHNARFEIFTDVASAPLIWDALKNDCQIVDHNYWELLEIQAGIPDVSLATQEQFVPQMLNLDILNAINFKKGCYTGQEIVARTHYLGSVKRRTYLAEIASLAAPGDIVTDAVQSEIGQIVRAAPNLIGSFDVLAEVRIDAVAGGVLTCNGVPLLIKTLPYSL